ncbi:MAG: response regulator, partial [Polyangiaceae bacterium]
EASTMLEALASTPAAPSTIVLDWQMPGLPGLEACKFVRTTRNQNALPILMLTGLSERADLVEAISAGANDYLTKPYDSAELLARVAAVVRTKLLHDRLLEAEVRERAARTEAQAANRSKDQFLAMASHELRTPLNAILGWVQLMRLGQLDEAGIARAIETIERNAKAQVQLIEDVLDGSRIMAGKQRLEIAPFDFSGVVRAAADSVKPALDAKDITLTVDLAPETAAAPVNGDAQRIQQVVGNLLSNALKFTPKGGNIGIRSVRVGSSVSLTIKDDGIGIASEFLPQVFERFRQAENTPSRRHGGLGLGLSLVRHFVEAHDGTVTVTSAGPGLGATFVVTLPAPLSAATDRPTPLTARRERDLAKLAGLKVLVVDDEADGRELVATALRIHGAAVTTADSADGALALFDSVQPAVVVSDIRMPKTDGFEFIRLLRSRPNATTKHVPALALTAYAQDETRKDALAAGFDMYLSKPVNPAELAAVVADLSTRTGST